MSELIPRDFIQLLLNRTEIVDLIEGRVPLRKKSGSNYFGCCPFHNEKTPSFSVSQSKQFYYCFGCGAHGNAIDFLMQHDHLSFPESVEALAKQAGLEIPREKSSVEKTISHDDLFALLENIAKYYQTELRQHTPAIDYLKKRGISGEIAKAFGIGFAPAGWNHVLQTFGQSPKQLLDAGMIIKKDNGDYYDRFRERVMFPIVDRRGRVIGFGGRILDQGEPKYLNSPETAIFQKGHELYGLFQALKLNRQLSRALIVEGYMDVIALFQHDVTYAVATLGTATTAYHLERLFRHTSHIIFCFDGDKAGRLAASRALQVILPLMRDGLQVGFMFLPEGEDPDSLIRKEGKVAFEKRMQEAMSLSNFFFQLLAEETDLQTMDGRARFVQLALQQLNQLPPSIFQQMMMEELAKRARIDVEKINPTKPQNKKMQLPIARKAHSPSALRLAMILLIQEPKLAAVYTDELPLLDIKGFNLFSEIFATIREHPELTTGGLLEFYRDREEGKLLAKLAQMEHMIPEKGVEMEFLGAIKQLKKTANKQVIDRLLGKANQEGLTQEEKQRLSELIKL